jgi:apolipoprotein N-acyltransferase
VNSLIYGFVSALFFSIFIYLEHFGLSHFVINSFFALGGAYMLLHANRYALSIAGFFIGLFWFWWIGLSFRHYDLSYLIPFVIVAIAFIYGVLFFLIGLLHPFLRIFAFTFLSMIPLLGFDWLRSEAVFVDTIFGVNYWQLFIVYTALFLASFKKRYLLLLVLAVDFSYAKIAHDDSIKLVQTDVSQKQKWDTSRLPSYVEQLFDKSESALTQGYEIIVFPESFLPTYLNTNEVLSGLIKDLSRKITIVTGALYYDEMPKNSTYIFHRGNVTIAHKVVLAPFGEANPLPEFMSTFVNKIFFDGALDYKAASEFTDFEINNKRYKNAICYEATDALLYTDRPKNVIVTSNNAWFVPSTQATLQKLLLKVYVKKLNVTIYHSANATASYILTQGSRWLF